VCRDKNTQVWPYLSDKHKANIYHGKSSRTTKASGPSLLDSTAISRCPTFSNFQIDNLQFPSQISASDSCPFFPYLSLFLLSFLSSPCINRARLVMSCHALSAAMSTALRTLTVRSSPSSPGGLSSFFNRTLGKKCLRNA
jgi:hypothetical protein